jgi:hypothetical protein
VGLQLKCQFQCAFYDHVNETQAFIKIIFSATVKAPLPRPLPAPCCAGGGRGRLFSATSRGFGYGFEAVWIRVKIT